jgi:ubiquinol-cytochrome c reductase iron-sulfur subunit
VSDDVPTPDRLDTPDAPPSATAPVVAFVASALAAVGLAVTYSLGGQPQVEGVLLAVALGGIGFGLVSWARRFMPDDVAVEERGTLASSPEDVQGLLDDLGAEQAQVGRRHLLVRMLAVAGGTLGIAALFPIRSLGPRPGRGLHTTPYAEGGLRLVTETGEAVRAEELAVNGVLTVFPEGYEGREDSQTLLLNLPEGDLRPREGREDWTVDGMVAFSKVCTHAGCPVGLFEEQTAQLLCPCHQSTFDVRDACRPIFGPATRSLPQLPLDTDEDGYLIATGDFSDPVGPGFWDRDR